VASFLLPFSLIVTGAIFTAGHATFARTGGHDPFAFALLRALVYCGLIAMFVISDGVVWTALWLGALPSIGLASHVWFSRAPRTRISH
jgi:hypothetical protein